MAYIRTEHFDFKAKEPSSPTESQDSSELDDHPDNSTHKYEWILRFVNIHIWFLKFVVGRGIRGRTPTVPHPDCGEYYIGYFLFAILHQPNSHQIYPQSIKFLTKLEMFCHLPHKARLQESCDIARRLLDLFRSMWPEYAYFIEQQNQLFEKLICKQI